MLENGPGRTRRRVLSVLMAAGVAVGGVLAVASPAQAAITTYISVLQPSGTIGPKVLDMRDYSKDDKGRAQLWQLRTSGEVRNQRWTITKVFTTNGVGVYEIKNLLSQKCLDKSQDVPDANGNVVYQYTCNRTDNQLWGWEEVQSGNKWGMLVNLSDGRCLDVTNVSYSDGAPLQVWDCSGGWNQRWNIS